MNIHLVVLIIYSKLLVNVDIQQTQAGFVFLLFTSDFYSMIFFILSVPRIRTYGCLKYFFDKVSDKESKYRTR